MMALNDIAIANEGLADWTFTTERKKLARQNGGRPYYGRMLMAHVYEALSIIQEIEGTPNLRALVQACDRETQSSFDAVADFLKTSDYQRLCRIRNNVSFHYVGKLAVRALDQIDRKFPSHASMYSLGHDPDPPPTKWSDLRYVSTSRRTAMARKRYKPEEIVAKLRQVDVLVSQGQDMADAIRQIGVSEVTYYRWRQEFGGLKIEQVKRLKELELENSRLRKAVSDLTLDKLILKEAARGNF